MCVWALCLLTEWKWVHAFRHFIFWLQLRLHCTQMLTCRGFSTSIINASDRSVTTKPASFWPSPRTVIFSNKWPLLHCPTASPLLPTGGVECVSGCFASNTSLLQLIKTVRCRLNYAVIVAADLHFNKGFPGPAERAKLIFFFFVRQQNFPLHVFLKHRNDLADCCTQLVQQPITPTCHVDQFKRFHNCAEEAWGRWLNTSKKVIKH